MGFKGTMRYLVSFRAKREENLGYCILEFREISDPGVLPLKLGGSTGGSTLEKFEVLPLILGGSNIQHKFECSPPNWGVAQGGAFWVTGGSRGECSPPSCGGRHRPLDSSGEDGGELHSQS